MRKARRPNQPFFPPRHLLPAVLLRQVKTWVPPYVCPRAKEKGGKLPSSSHRLQIHQRVPRHRPLRFESGRQWIDDRMVRVRCLHDGPLSLLVGVQAARGRGTRGREVMVRLVWVAASVILTVSDLVLGFDEGSADMEGLDASVTQSALEEALASKMQDGGTIGSRMSTISQAIRSRYMPKAPPRRPQGS
jgi:hypothetical protein